MSYAAEKPGKPEARVTSMGYSLNACIGCHQIPGCYKPCIFHVALGKNAAAFSHSLEGYAYH